MFLPVFLVFCPEVSRQCPRLRAKLWDHPGGPDRGCRNRNQAQAARALLREFRAGYGRPLERDRFNRHYEVRGATHRNVFDLAVVDSRKNKLQESLFQHILLLPDPEESYTQAAGLCWRWVDIQAANHVDRELTAVLYERPDKESRGSTDAVRLLKKQDISVVGIEKLSSLVRKLDHQGRLFVD